MTWDPASKVPVHPSAAIFHASGPRFTKNSETIVLLPGGKNCVKSAIRSNRLVLAPIRLVANATAISNVGKNARKRLKAIACEITLHRGNTRANIPYIRRWSPAAEFIAGHYTCDGHSLSEALHLRRRIRIASKLSMLLHVKDREGFTIRQGDRDWFHGYIALRAEELCAGQRCPHLVASKPGGPRRIFASLQDHAADSAARPIGMNEESANFCCIAKRVQQLIFASRPMVAPIERLALAPAAASDDHQSGWRVLCSRGFGRIRVGLRHDVGSVGDKLAIDAKNGFERAFDLIWGVVPRLQCAHGCVDQFAQNGNIFRNSEAEVNVRLHHRSKAGTMESILSPSDVRVRQNSACPAS